MQHLEPFPAYSRQPIQVILDSNLKHPHFMLETIGSPYIYILDNCANLCGCMITHWEKTEVHDNFVDVLVAYLLRHLNLIVLKHLANLQTLGIILKSQ